MGGGLHQAMEGTTELCGISVLPSFRRRGVAGAISSALITDAFAMGCNCVFLSAADEQVERIYARIGFQKIGTAMDATGG